MAAPKGEGVQGKCRWQSHTHVLSQTTEWEQIVGTLKTKPRIHTHTPRMREIWRKTRSVHVQGFAVGFSFVSQLLPETETSARARSTKRTGSEADKVPNYINQLDATHN